MTKPRRMESSKVDGAPFLLWMLTKVVWSTPAKGSSRTLTLIALAVCALEKMINADNEH